MNSQNQQSKENKKTTSINKIIDNALLIILILAVTYAIIDGRYIHKEIQIIEVCNGIMNNIRNISGLP